MPHVSPWLDHVLKQHISGTRPPSALVQRIARQFIYGSKATDAAAESATRSTMRAKPAVLKGAPRSEVNTKGDLGSWSR
jgi:hypothetical protein